LTVGNSQRTLCNKIKKHWKSLTWELWPKKERKPSKNEKISRKNYENKDFLNNNTS